MRHSPIINAQFNEIIQENAPKQKTQIWTFRLDDLCEYDVARIERSSLLVNGIFFDQLRKLIISLFTMTVDEKVVLHEFGMPGSEHGPFFI